MTRLVPAWWRDRPPIPLDLTAVALVFGIERVYAGIAILRSAMQGHINLNISVLGVAIGVGLLQLDASAYRWAKRCVWFAVVLLVGILISGVAFGVLPELTEIGRHGKPLTALQVWVLVIAALVQTIWQQKVLRREDIRRLFESHSAAAQFQRRRQAQLLNEFRAHEEATHGQAVLSSYDGASVMSRVEPGLITVSRKYDATAEDVVDQWLDPESVRRFMVGSKDGRNVRVTVDARVNGHFQIMDARTDNRVGHRGAFVEISRAGRLVFWYAFNRRTMDAQVTLDLVATPGGSALTLTQRGDATWKESPQDAAVRWARVLDNLDRQLRLRSTNL